MHKDSKALDLDGLIEAIKSKNIKDREFIDFDDLAENSNTIISSIKELLIREVYLTTIDAQKYADAFWEQNKESRESGDPDEQGRLGTRVVLLNNTIMPEWYNNRFKPMPGNKSKVYSRRITLGNNSRYTKHSFKNANPRWEKDVALMIEDRYELIRKRSAVLSKLRRNLAEYKRLLDKCYPED